MFKKLFLLLVPVVLMAQSGNIISINSQVKPAELTPGKEGRLTVECIVASGYHLSGYNSGMFEIVPGKVIDVNFGAPEYPPGDNNPYIGSIYHGSIQVEIEFYILPSASFGKKEIPITVKYQACSEDGSICYTPAEQKTSAVFTIINTNQNLVSAESNNDQTIADRLGKALEKTSLIAFIIVFMGGVLSSLTPCVYPMIPITLAVIGAQAGEKKLKGFILSLFYVLGIAVTFSILGMVAARTGMVFGTISNHPVVLIIIFFIFLIMGLSLLGLFVLQLPPSLADKLQGRKGKGFLGSFLTGLIAGVIISPCISPLLVVILAWVAKSGSLIMGAGLLFTYALGLGLLFILIGTFSGIIKALPKSGGWMAVIERGLGLVLIILAIVFIKPILPLWMHYILWSIFFIFIGTFGGGLKRLTENATSRDKFSQATGLTLIITGSIFLFFGLSQMIHYPLLSTTKLTEYTIRQKSPWLADADQGFTLAAQENKPLILDFYAEWCAACKELDEKTWSDPQIRQRLSQFITVKLDVTKSNDQTKMYRGKYNIYGMPTVIFFQASGKELARFEGFKSSQEVLNIMDQIL
jgi:thiol:disulfide interchange protein DsbD